MAARDRSILFNESASERSLADVKSQRPDTPMLVSRAMRKRCRRAMGEAFTRHSLRPLHYQEGPN